jgi:hypothetical protein
VAESHPPSRFAILDQLLGTWTFEITTDGPPIVRGRAIFAHAEAGAFVRFQQFADPWLPTTPDIWKKNSPFPTVTMIGADDPSGTFAYAYTDRRGVRRVQQMTFVDRVWRAWGKAGPAFYQRFEGTLSEDGRWIDGYIDRSADNKHWERDFQIRYHREGNGAA